METDYLKEFIHVSKSLSYTKTSLAMSSSQPALSRHISILERDFDLKIHEPHTVLTSQNIRTTNVIKDLRDGEIDLLVSFLSASSPLIDEFESAFLFSEKVCPLINKNNPFATLKSAALRDVEEYFFLLSESDSALNESIMDMLKRAGVTPKTRTRVVASVELRNDGIAPYTETSAKMREAEQSKLIRCNLSDPEAYYNIYTLWRKDFALDLLPFVECVKTSYIHTNE